MDIQTTIIYLAGIAGFCIFMLFCIFINAFIISARIKKTNRYLITLIQTTQPSTQIPISIPKVIVQPSKPDISDELKQIEELKKKIEEKNKQNN